MYISICICICRLSNFSNIIFSRQHFQAETKKIAFHNKITNLPTFLMSSDPMLTQKSFASSPG